MKDLPTPNRNFEVKSALDAVSPAFCLAKWLQGTIHLGRGITHSCHHPLAHHIPLEEIEKNPAALNNTREKIETRRSLLAGKQHSECQYCWNIENSGSEHFSDRIHLSKNSWALPFLDEILKDPLSDQILPRYLEVSFSRACNFKCSYCAPAFSSKWAQDILESGTYPAREHEQTPELLADLYPSEENPYTKAFWDWWPRLKSSLHTFRITGGEPLLSPHTYKILNLLSEEPEPRLNLAINSNLSVSEALMEKFVHLAQDLLQHKKIQQLEIYTSIEADDKQAEYIRHGLDAKVFWKNVEKILQTIPDIKIIIMCTFNALSITSYRKFLEKVLVLREKYADKDQASRIYLDISYLRHPFFQAVNILPGEYCEEIKKSVNFMAENNSAQIKKGWGFYTAEQKKLERILHWMGTKPSESYLEEKRADFYRFFNEHDRRRGTNFLETFPEMASYWESCRALSLDKPAVS